MRRLAMCRSKTRAKRGCNKRARAIDLIACLAGVELIYKVVVREAGADGW